MSKLEDLQLNVAVQDILLDCLVTVINVQWFGSEALDLTYKIPEGKQANELLSRHHESRIEAVEQGRSNRDKSVLHYPERYPHSGNPRIQSHGSSHTPEGGLFCYLCVIVDAGCLKAVPEVLFKRLEVLRYDSSLPFG